MKYELIVFDWDGTLMDSEARIVTCMQLAADDTGFSRPSDAAVREIIGLSLEKAVSQLFETADESVVNTLTEAYREHWLGDDVPHSVLFPHAGDVIETLERDGYLLAIATGKSRRGLDKVLQESGLGPKFHASRCGDETFSKPHPQMLEEILVDLNTGPERALVIGDTEYDMQMAANARVDALGVSYGVHSGERLLAQGAKHVLDGLNELPVWLAENRI
jgi:phosphoglycolate phosphatase